MVVEDNIDDDPYGAETRDILERIAQGSSAPKGDRDLGISVSELRANIDVIKVGPEDRIRHNERMTEPLTRPELDAKLENVGLTLDRRIDGIEAKLDGLKSDVASTKSTVMWMAALIVGAVVATAGLVVTSFDSGRDTAEMAAQARADTTAALLEIRQAVDEIKAHRPPAEQPTQ